MKQLIIIIVINSFLIVSYKKLIFLLTRDNAINPPRKPIKQTDNLRGTDFVNICCSFHIKLAIVKFCIASIYSVIVRLIFYSLENDNIYMTLLN